MGGGMAIALFGYLGVETAAVAAAKVRDPDKNIPRATILGPRATAVVYLLSPIAVFGILPTTASAEATAPFSDAANTVFGGTWAGSVMAVAVIISGFGALNGWTMICAEIRSPPRRTAYSPSASTESGITAAIPHAFSSLAQLKWRPADRRALEGRRFVRDVTVAVVSLVFSTLRIWYSRNTGQPFWLYWAPFILAAAALLPGDPVYRSQRHRMNEPAQVPAYR
ncbi:amino acid permease [Amycolatopsis sp. NPDC049253]|uniref:APC family permease n=1 Tax=Amycolatopsis sp. NPDC049253 TaxID=3155274 RepID=UPI0034267E56